jgi:hypothetical protein
MSMAKEVASLQARASKDDGSVKPSMTIALAAT